MDWRFCAEYAHLLFNSIPLAVYWASTAAFVLIVVIAFGVKGVKVGCNFAITTLLVEYICLIICSAVLCRPPIAERAFNLLPFWSYFAYFRNEDDQLMPQIMFNVLMFIPIGFLSGAYAKRVLSLDKRQMISFVFIIGLVLSIGIEAFQFILKRGLAEFDDVIHNVLGCLIGYLLYRVIVLKVIK